MLKYFSIKDWWKIIMTVCLTQTVIISILFGLLKADVLTSSILSFIGTIFAISKLKLDVNIEVKTKKEPL